MPGRTAVSWGGMTPAATVIVPTHNHGPLLTPAVRSALRQTVQDVEVMIVGDGMTADTRAAAQRLAGDDPRVRCLENPKGPRTGETHRRRAIAESRAPAILYLSDDDLWLPEHVEHVLGLLEGHDVVNALSVWVGPTGIVQHTTLDLALPFHRDEVRRTARRRRSPDGPHARLVRAPAGGLAHDARGHRDRLLDVAPAARDPACRARSGFIPTIVHLPSPQRREMTLEQRLEELDATSGSPPIRNGAGASSSRRSTGALRSARGSGRAGRRSRRHGTRRTRCWRGLEGPRARLRGARGPRLTSRCGPAGRPRS